MSIDAELRRALDEGLLALIDRLDNDYLGRRLRRQVDHVARFFGAGRPGLHIEELGFVFSWMQQGLRWVGLAQRAEDNVLTPEVSFNRFELARLPHAFEGVRVLHLSDLHLDCPTPGRRLVTAIAERVGELSFDLCVITGDFRYTTRGDYFAAMREMAELVPALRCPLGIFGVLGNHDFIEQVPILEHLGVKMLVNEAVALRRDGCELWLVGVDDPHFYHTDSLARACAAVPPGACALALVHSPELNRRAASIDGLALYLCGHTHAGQLCLPGGWAPFLNARSARRFCAGAWRVADLVGYTSRGTGSSGIPARLNCAPEIALHRLYSATNAR